MKSALVTFFAVLLMAGGVAISVATVSAADEDCVRSKSSTATPPAQPCDQNTGLRSPTADVPASGGDGNGFELYPTKAYANDGVFAKDVDSGTDGSTSCTSSTKDKHVFFNYGFSIPSTATIKGIEVRLDAKADSTSGSPKMCVQLSWDGGSSWTAAKSTATLGTTEGTQVLGGTTDTWGHTWAVTEFANAKFRVRVIDVSSSTSRDFFLDWVAVRVDYQN